MGKSRNRKNGASQGVPFFKCYSRLLGVFEPEEIVFMLYMADLSRLRGKGFDTLRSKKTHMANTGIGSRLFDRCVRRMTALGLLKRVPLKGMYDYLWDGRAYERLITILNAPASALDARTVGRQLFVSIRLSTPRSENCTTKTGRTRPRRHCESMPNGWQVSRSRTPRL